MFERNRDTLKYTFLIGILCIGMTACGNTDSQSAAEQSGTEILSITEPLTDMEDATEESSESKAIQDKEISHEIDEASENNESQQTEDNESAEPIFIIQSQPIQHDNYKMQDWQAAYAEYIDKLEWNQNNTYSLIYVDDDDIPELVIDTGVEAGGCQILTFYNGEIDLLQTDRLNFYYMEKKNLINNSDGHMGYYYDYIYSIVNGKWVYVTGGEWTETMGDDDWVYQYEWEGKKVGENTYEQKVNAVINVEQAIVPEQYYILEEMLSLLRTGDCKSRGHYYELFIEDVTWDEAKRRCEERGGYLATVTAIEELESIRKGIQDSGQADIAFWVGASHEKEKSGKWWHEPNQDSDSYTMSHYNAYRKFWAADEPSVYIKIGEGILGEDGVYIAYDDAEGTSFLYDAPKDILAMYPEYEGKIGYICEYDSLRGLGEYTSSATIDYVETSIEQQGNELIFDNLSIELPKGVTAEIKTSDIADDDEKAMQTINLIGAERLVGDADSYRSTGPFPPQIRLSHYRADYECEEALISALLNLFPNNNLRVQYEDQSNSEYIFRLGNWDFRLGNWEYGSYYYYYALVKGEDLYLIGEFYLESGYGFSALREQGKVKWHDSNIVVSDDTDLNEAYFKIMPEEGWSFLCHDDSELYFYLDGYFAKCYMSYEKGKNGYIYGSDLEDVNFDGYTDINTNSRGMLVWDPPKKEFLEVEYPEDMPSLYLRESFPETETIWGYDNDYMTDAWSSHDMDHTESLWQWDGYTLVKIRECKAEIREDEVRIRAYGESIDDIIFDERLTPKEWDDDSNGRKKALYEQFYDGLAPKEFFYPDEEKVRTKVPQGLLDKITDSMMKGTEFETLKAMMNSVELTTEEKYALAEQNDEIRANILESYHSGNCILAAADVDNDGIEDIIGEFYWGGTGGFVDYILFQGQEDGTYKQTDSFDSVREEFGAIIYKGKNYLVRTLYDYGKKFYNGFGVTVYENGIHTEEVYLMLYVDDYDLTLIGCKEGYETCAEDIMDHAVMYDEMVEDYERIEGSAEELAESNAGYKYVCDLDNDGELEYYNKYIWTCSNMYTVDSLSFEPKDDDGAALIKEAIRERCLRDEYYNPIMLWADEVDGEPVVSVMYRTSLEDFVILGYVVSGSECTEVYEIAADARLGVKQTHVAE